jgi:DNA replicative helicase MCM subunit Mcm2 (Cdc46/Mcm family)
LNLGILNNVIKKTSVPENSLVKYGVRKTDKLFDPIFGFDDIKEIFQLSINADKPVHILLVGPPASAKSLFMGCLTKLERSYYAIGSSSTKSGDI